MRYLLVGTDTKYASAGGVVNTAFTPNLLDLGSVGIYGVDPKGITAFNGKDKLNLIVGLGTANSDVVGSYAINAAAFTGKSVRFCVGLGSGKFYQSPSFQVAGLQYVNGNKYVAPVAQILYVGYDEVIAAQTILIDTVNYTGPRNNATIKVIENLPGTYDKDFFYYNVNYAAGMTAVQLCTALATAVNNPIDGSAPIFTASVVNSGASYGVKMVVNDVERNFDVTGQEAIEGSPTTKKGPTIGAGYPAQLKRIERYSNVYRGDFYLYCGIDKHLATQVNDAKTYDTYDIFGINQGLAKDGQKTIVDNDVHVMVAFEVEADVVGTNQQADFENIMEILYPKTISVSA